MKKILPISIIAVLTAIPAFADITNESMCVVDTLGQSNNESTAGIEAIWIAQSIHCDPGYYLNGITAICTQCPVGSYCSGGTYTHNGTDQGKTLCSTNYTSLAGSDNINQCYQNGTVQCSTYNPYTGGHGTANYANQTATCKTYYGEQKCTLTPFTACDYSLLCDSGYHNSEGPMQIPELQPYVNKEVIAYGYKRLNGQNNYYIGSLDNTNLANGSWLDKFSDNTIVTGTSACVRSETSSNFKEFVESISSQLKNGSITEDEAYEKLYASNEAHRTSGAFVGGTIEGPGCWCKIDSYSILGENTISINGEWIYHNEYDTKESCSDSCATACAQTVKYSSGTRPYFFSEFPQLQCIATTYNITYVLNDGANYSNAPVTYTVEELPISLGMPEKSGYGFYGWSLTENGEIITEVPTGTTGDITLYAHWIDACDGGYYLPANTTQCVQCPIGSYCGGGAYNYYSVDQGKTLCPENYTSDTGTSYEDQCYMSGTQTCSEYNPYTGGHGTANYANQTATCKTYYGSEQCALDNANACDITSLSCVTGYHEYTNPLASYVNADLSNLNANDGNIGLKSGDGEQSINADNLNNGEFFIQWPDGATIYVATSCNDTVGSYDENATSEMEMITSLSRQPANAFSSTSTGTNCWFQMKRFDSSIGTTLANASDWVWMPVPMESAEDCASQCAIGVGDSFAYAPIVRTLIMGSGSSCNPNTINLQWFADTVENGAVTPFEVQSEAQQCIYDGAITLPSTNPTKTGYTFTGWRLRQ